MATSNPAEPGFVSELGIVRMSSDVTSDLDTPIARLAEGDRSAFTPAFRLLWPRMRDLCRSLLKNEADAADAAQQALEKVLTRSAEYDRSRPALPWALAIAAWECRTLLRKRSRRRELPEDLAPERSTEPSEEGFAHPTLRKRRERALSRPREAFRKLYGLE
jgi:RNA polymerase sigma-70 factor (ECF subfamily)